MKKSIIVIVHVLAVLLLAVAFSALYMSSTGDFGIRWVSSGNYEDSPQFAEAVNTDIGNLKRLALYEDAFGDVEELSQEDNGLPLVTATDGQKTIEYTAAELLEIARSFGCTIDFATGQVTLTEFTSQDAENSDLHIISKVYDPWYLKDVEPGPSQGIMSMKELSIEVVKTISDYISLVSTYIRSSSNFSFMLYSPGQNDGYVSLTNTDSRADSLLKQGRYVHVEGGGQTVETNIFPAPESAVYTPYGNLTDDNADYYEIFVGIDTEFPYQDRYRIEADAFEGKVRTAYTWIAAGIISFIIAVITLVLILSQGANTGEHIADRLPIEAFTVILAVCAVIAYFLYKLTLGKVLETLSPTEDEAFIRSVAKTLITYGMIILILRSGIRKYRAGTLYSTSLFNRLELNIEEYLENATLAGSAFLRFFVFVVTNAGLAFFAYLLYVRREENARYILISAVLLTVLIITDALSYHRFYKTEKQRDMIDEALRTISGGETEVSLSEEEFSGGELAAAKSINNISTGLTAVVHDQVKSERLKADLITNVSHDLKTPLTSIINYVGLLKRENIQNEKAAEYIDVLERKSLRLKNLTEDLVEASKASSGNIRMEMTTLDIVELSEQAAGEFTDKFAARGLEFCFDRPEEPFFVRADGRHLWRVFENLFNNAAKYSLENTRIYGEVSRHPQASGNGTLCVFTIKNISAAKLNISPEELTERFVRGDVSRTTEGSGLGLSIAQSLTKLMGGELRIEIDGDLYKASVILPEAPLDVPGENDCHPERSEGSFEETV